ncbi:type II secretion system protein N [Azoarcus sp. L1K30]|uniref:type II secretion system protein N n=1 Tax=Azoarcus sp. L1K30 TaxID=2820277 RepID=UPI001B81836B|nr:type II secretion system protein N [Azoarcus sp. L1K30]MBR0565822.1 type II secretion system protein N [Azoarcus sp. L1K30]
MRPFLLLLLVAAGLVVAHAPSSLLDTVLAQASDGHLRLASPRGSLWRGSAELASAGEARMLEPWAKAAWRLDLPALLHGQASWTLEVDDRPAGRLSVGIHRWKVEQAAISLPLPPLLQALPHPAFHFGWRGRADVHGPGIECDWQARCSGRLVLAWRDAGTDILPMQTLGGFDFEFDAGPHPNQGQAATALSLTVSSQANNRLVINGRIGLAPDDPPRVDLSLGGEAGLIDRIAPLLEQIARRDGDRLLIRQP